MEVAYPNSNLGTENPTKVVVVVVAEFLEILAPMSTTSNSFSVLYLDNKCLEIFLCCFETCCLGGEEFFFFAFFTAFCALKQTEFFFFESIKLRKCHKLIINLNQVDDDDEMKRETKNNNGTFFFFFFFFFSNENHKAD